MHCSSLQRVKVAPIFSPNQILFEILNFYIMKTANIPVHGNITMYL